MPIAIQMAPSFYIGLYSPYRPHPWSLAIPALIMIAGAIVIQSLYADQNIHPAVLSVLLNLGLVIVCELTRLIWIGRLKLSAFKSMKSLRNVLSDETQENNRPEWDQPKVQRSGSKALSPDLLNAMMAGYKEPIKNFQYLILIVVASVITTPMTPELQPPLEDDGSWSILPKT